MASVAVNGSMFSNGQATHFEERNEEQPGAPGNQFSPARDDTRLPCFVDPAGLPCPSGTHNSSHEAQRCSTFAKDTQSLPQQDGTANVLSLSPQRYAPAPPQEPPPGPIQPLSSDGGALTAVHPPLLTRTPRAAATSAGVSTSSTLSARAPSFATRSPTTLPSATESLWSDICEPISDELGMQAQVGTYSLSAKKNQAFSKTSQNGSFIGKRLKKVRAPKSKSDVLKAKYGPWIITKRDKTGRIVGSEGVYRADPLVRAARTLQQIQATFKTRCIGACDRCRRKRCRCDRPLSIYGVCVQCLVFVANMIFTTAPPPKHTYQPCLRVGLLDVRLHRKGPTIDPTLGDWVKDKLELVRIEDSRDTCVLSLSQGFGEGDGCSLRVTVSSFKPADGDKTAYFWSHSSGNPQSFEVPPYFISDVDEARDSLREFVINARPKYIKKLLAESNTLVSHTFQAAWAHARKNESTLVFVALNYWVAARLIEDQWRVTNGGEDIGLGPTPDELDHPWRDFAPVTPMMDMQLDYLVIDELLEPMLQVFLKDLESKINERKRENWLDIYFAIFIMMSNMGRTVKDMRANAEWKGFKSGRRGGNLTEGFIHACKSMLAYFHFECAGCVPLTLLNENRHKGDKKYYPLSNTDVEYLEFVQSEIDRSEAIRNWKDLSMYEDDSYWCYQLLYPEWQGDILHNGEIDDYREEDFLSSSTS